MRRFFAGASLAVMVIASSASAQETTSIIRGIVTASGAPVNDAEVTITNVPSGTVSRARTDSSGGFSQAGLRAGGPYTVDVTSTAGSTKITDIFTVIGQPYDLPVELSASVADIVVTASSIKKAGISGNGPQTTLDQVDIAKVASVNRDIRDIERRSPFATIDLSNNRAVSFAGVNPRFNRFTINGAQVGDTFGLNPDASPTRRGPVPFDALGQVSVSVADGDIRQGNVQGGTIDTTLLAGTNDYHVNGFYSQSTDGLQGDRIGNNVIVLPKYRSETYGVVVSGPIIKDRIFLMVAGERNTDPRPLSPGAVNQVPNLTDKNISDIQAIAKSVYNYDTGGILAVTNNLDEKFAARLDVNVSDSQKLSFSYINAYDANDNPQNSSNSVTAPQIGLASNAYKLTELLRAGIIQLNSDWTDKFATETRFVYKSYKRGQDPSLGRGFAQFRVCTSPTSSVDIAGAPSTGNTVTSCGTGNPVVAFGPDISRQTNALFTDTYDGSLLLRYSAGNHAIKALFQYVENRTTNAFLQNSAGAYYFDSIADLQNRAASSFAYQNALTLNPDDTNANFKYGQWTVGLQDDWTISDSLRVTAGLRYDLFETEDRIPVNQPFVSRNGFSNANSFGGLYAFQPRASFNYKPTPTLSIRGSAGVFAGGTPDIYFSNAYSNTGTRSNSIQTVVRAAPTTGGATTACAAPYTGANAAVCTAALNNVVGAVGSIPGVVNTFLTTNTASLTTAPTASVAPDFRIPSVTKATISVDKKFFGINFGADYLYTKTNQSVQFIDLRSVRVGTLPDGRPRYNFRPTPAVTATADTNQDIQFGNTGLGRSHIGVVRFDKEFDFGLSLSGSYTYQDVKDLSPATASTAGSLYGQAASNDPNNAVYGRSNDETKWQFKYNVGFDHAFFRDYRTVIQLFGETRAGRPYSYTLQNTTPGGRSAVFGTTGTDNRYLMYVPTSANDPLVSYDSAATQTAVENLINTTKLRDYRGQIAAKNIARSRANTRIDLHLEQEFPTFVGSSRVILFADIENLPNLLNRDWGGFNQVAFPYTASVAQVACLSSAVATGTPVANIGTTGIPNPAAAIPQVVNTTSSQTCAQYRYSQYRAPNEVTTVANSLYLIRIGARFKF